GEESGGNWALYANDTPLKQAARRMVLMTKQINDANFGGRQVVTCYSCHRGLARPKVTPSLVALYVVPPDEPDDVVVAAPNATKAERPFPVELMSGQELDGTRLEAELAFPTRIKQALTGMRVGLPVSIGDRDANVIQGRTAAGTLVSLYFDTQTGLLTRLMRYSDSPVGRIVTQYDYEDYRPVA